MSSNHIKMIHSAYKKAMARSFTLPFPTETDANAFRQSMYNAVRGIKKNGCAEDYELERAVHEIEVVKGGKPNILLLRRKTESVGMQVLAKALGIEPEKIDSFDVPDLSDLDYLTENQDEADKPA